MDKLIAEVRSQIEGYETFHKRRKNNRRPADLQKFHRMIEAICCDLCLVTLSDDVDAVHLSRSNKVLRSSTSRYKSEVLSGKLPDLLDIMAAPEMAFVEMTIGATTFKVAENDLKLVPTVGRQTTLLPGPKLRSRIEKFGVSASDVAPSDDQEPIVLPWGGTWMLTR